MKQHCFGVSAHCEHFAPLSSKVIATEIDGGLITKLIQSQFVSYKKANN
jgi:hypothetical protein